MPVAIAELSETLSNIVESTGKSVVRVEGGHRRPVSGLVWSPRQVVTVAHGVPLKAPGGGDVGRENEVVVAIEGQQFKARVKGRDETTDLALLELDDALPPATFDDGAGVKVGQLALRLARPGETVRATSGIVSAVGKKTWRTPAGGEVDFYLETDAPHQSGFNGGPLIDVEGRVLGLTSASVLRGTSLAIPTKTIRRVVAQLEQHGKVRRSYLGLQLQPVQLPDSVRTSTGEEIGLLVTSVEKGGPADQAGLQYGDTVLHLGDDSVKTLQDLYRYLRADHADEQVPLKYFRNGQVTTSQVTLGGR